MFSPVIGHDYAIYCSIECLRHALGAIANPIRFAMHCEWNDYCHNPDCEQPLLELEAQS